MTERVNSPSPPLRGTSPIGRGKTLVRLALAGDARASSLYTREPGVLPHQRVCLFQQYFYAGEFIMAGGAEEDRPCSERGSGALEENRLFSPGASPDSGVSARPPTTKAPTRICRERHSVSSMSGSSGRGTAAVFSDFWQMPELDFSGFRPLLPPESPTPAVASL